MYRKTFQKDYLTILNAEGPHPLRVWTPKVKTGYVKRVWDTELSGLAVEIRSSNVSACALETVSELGVSLPFLVLIVKNIYKYFTFQITIRDDFGMRRRLRFSNFQSRTRIGTFDCSIPLCLDLGKPWNLIRIDLPRLTQQAFNSTYVETVQVVMHANCRLRRIYFCRVLLPDDKLPKEYSAYVRPRTRTERRKPKVASPFLESPQVPPPTPSAFVEDRFSETGDDDEEQSEDFTLTLQPSSETSEHQQVDTVLYKSEEESPIFSA